MKGDVVKLREETGAGVMECKKAFDEAKGDFEKAKQIIAERAVMKADSKKERKTGTGFLHSYIHNERVGVLLEVRCETDFVARSDAFQEMVHELALHIAAMGPENVSSLLSSPFVKDESITVSDFIKGTIAKTGENINIERFARFEV